MLKKSLGVLFICALSLFSGCSTQSADSVDVIRVGYFPNITHAQALIGLADGSFQKAIGENIIIEPKTFNAGPEEIEALFAGEIDIGYVGPSPAVNGYIQSNGEALKIVAGAMSGGAVLVLQPELAAAFAQEGPSALAGKKIASPQQGNTQDISLRYYLKQNNLTDLTQVVPIANADQLTLFSTKELDGAWSPEPWASRLIDEAGAVLVLDERTLWPDQQFATTVVIVRTEFLEQHPDVVQQWVEGHQLVTDWIISHPTEAQTIVNQEIEKLTTKSLKPAVLTAAWARLDPSTTILEDSITTFAQRANELGVLDNQGVDFNSLYDKSFTASPQPTGSQ